MTQEKIYNEEVAGDAGFTEGEGYPACEGAPCANVAPTASNKSTTRLRFIKALPL